MVPCLPSRGRDGIELGGCTDKIPRRCTPEAKLGWSEEGAVFSLNVALNLALVPSDALSIRLLGKPLHSWTHSCSPVFPSSHSIPQPGAKTQNLNRGPAPLPTHTVQCILAQFGCRQYCPPRTGQASFTQYRVSSRESLSHLPHPSLLYLQSYPFLSCVPEKCLATFAKGGLRGEGLSQGSLTPHRYP